METRRTPAAILTGMVSELPNENCWTLAEQAGDTSPGRMQQLLSAAVVDDDGLRDDLRDYVLEHLGDADATLVVDETCDIKKGMHTVGVQRQYTGTAGRIENSQVAVYPTYATRTGHAFVDRALYLPKSWTTDPGRCSSVEVAVPGFAVRRHCPIVTAGILPNIVFNGTTARGGRVGSATTTRSARPRVPGLARRVTSQCSS
ncbi:transposase [Streptomyces gardneri]|nr:transposase [Streptomyces gardneri]